MPATAFSLAAGVFLLASASARAVTRSARLSFNAADSSSPAARADRAASASRMSCQQVRTKPFSSCHGASISSSFLP